MQQIEITLHKGNYPISEVRDFIAVICRRWGFSQKFAYQIKTAVDETLTNIVRHAYKNKAGRINIKVRFGHNKITISVKDWGKPLTRHPRTEPSDLVQTKKDHGLGLVMIDRLMDTVTRTHKGKYNELVLVKYLNNTE